MARMKASVCCKRTLLVSMVIGLMIIVGGSNPVFGVPDLTDETIKNAVRDELLFDQAVLSNNIDVTCVDGIVTLTGKLETLLARERAAKIAETVKGVRSVINRIKVVPIFIKSDKVLKNDVKQALLLDPATESYEIDVNVDDKTVTLTGSVDSWMERDLASKVAKRVGGVKAVENRIQVDYKQTRSDGEITTEIQEALRWDTLVDHVLIDVAVNDGNVVLKGTVGSAAEKTQAKRDAWVAGVKTIDVSGLDVARWARDEDLRKDKYEAVPDEAVEKAVEKALLFDPRVDATGIEVTVTNGIVSLSGKVDNLKAKRSATQDARNTVGVFRVKNRLNVRPTEVLGDDKVERKVREALARDPYVESYEITVDVIAGVADLYGTVDSYFEKIQAEDVVSRTPGVLMVDNNLAVNKLWQPFVYNPYVDPYSGSDYKWYSYDPGRTMKSDLEIELDIEDELWWSPFVDADQVNVDVDDGEATLTGTVDSWSEYYAAGQNALEGGAAIVDNELVVSSSN